MRMKNEKRERVRAQLNQARRELDIAKHQPYFTCDVCGPYGHTFHVCHSSVANAFQGFLDFHDREPGEIHGLNRLVALAAEIAPGFGSCVDKVLAMYRCGELTEADFNYKPTESEYNEAIQLAEELIAVVSSALPEDVR
jgi:hypothetical protein